MSIDFESLEKKTNELLGVIPKFKYPKNQSQRNDLTVTVEVDGSCSFYNGRGSLEKKRSNCSG